MSRTIALQSEGAITRATIDPTLSEVLVRQEPLALTLPKSVSIIGCGGVGAWIAMFLALARVPHITLWDFDTVSSSNLNRLPLGAEYIDQVKSLALKHMLHRLTNVDIVALMRWSPTEAMVMGYGPREDNDNHWIVAATDTWQSRRDIYAHAQEQRLRYIEASAEGEYGGITGEPATFATEDETNPGYASVPVHVGPCVAAASMAAYFILHDIAPGTSNYRLGWNRDRHIIDMQQML